MTIHFAEGLSLPDDAATQVFAFMGRRGSGKTYGAGRLVEQLHAHRDQVVILDPVGTWWGLRLAADGKGPGLEVPVFGGWHGDIPLQATAGKVVAELVAERGTSLVLDVSEFTLSDQRRFVADFATELFHAKKRNRSALMVVFEEAQEFAPQHVRNDMTRMVGAVERLVKLGRNFGVGAALLSQRPQAVNKDVLNLTEVLCAFQLAGPQERKAIAGWVQEKGAAGRDELGDELPSLPVGTAMVWSPQWLQHFGKHKLLPKKTYDASATPKAGKAKAAAPLAPIDLNAVKEAMAATIEDAKANDPTALKAEVARLRRELEGAKKATPAAKTVEVPFVPRHVRGDVEKAREVVNRLTEAVGTLAARIDSALIGMIPVVGPPERRTAVASSSPARASRAAPSTAANGDWRPSSTQRRMLQQLATSPEEGLTRRQLATLSGIKATTGTYRNNLSGLRVNGCITTAGERVQLTERGRELAGDVAVPVGGADLLAYWRGRLSGSQAAMLADIVIAGRISREALAEGLGVKADTGTFRNNLSILRTRGLLTDEGGVLVASELFFR